MYLMFVLRLNAKTLQCVFGVLFGHYYSSGTQVVMNVTAHSDIFLSHLTNTDMKYVISYAIVCCLRVCAICIGTLNIRALPLYITE
jgi:hypothetical protein